MKITDLQPGDVIRWRNTGIGNGYAQTEIIAFHRKRTGILRRVADYWEAITHWEPAGWPERGSLYQVKDRHYSLSDVGYMMSYGVLDSVKRDGKQIWPKVEG
jgi:hypothetical protein